MKSDLFLAGSDRITFGVVTSLLVSHDKAKRSPTKCLNGETPSLERRASRVLFLFPSNELLHPVGKTARFLHSRSQQHPLLEVGRWEFKPPYVNILQDVDIYTNSSFIIVFISKIGFFWTFILHCKVFSAFQMLPSNRILLNILISGNHGNIK